MPLACCWEWFPEKTGIVSGILFCAFGFSTFLFGFLATFLVNPDNVKPVDNQFPTSVTDKVPDLMKVLALCFSILYVIGTLLVTRNPAYVERERSRKSSLLTAEP